MFKYNSPEAQAEIRKELATFQEKISDAMQEAVQGSAKGSSYEDTADLSDMSEVLEFALEQIERKFNLMEWHEDEVMRNHFNEEIGETIWEDSEIGEYEESLDLHNFSLLTALSHFEMLADKSTKLSSPDETIYTSDRSNSTVFTPAKIAENCLNTMDRTTIDVIPLQELLESKFYTDEEFFSAKKRLAIKVIVEASEIATESLKLIAEGKTVLTTKDEANNESSEVSKGNQASQNVAQNAFEKINKIIHL